MWQAIHLCLPCVTELKKRNLNQSEMCPYCGDEPETIYYILYDYIIVKDTKTLLNKEHCITANSATLWWASLINTKGIGLFWNEIIICWRLWIARNQIPSFFFYHNQLPAHESVMGVLYYMNSLLCVSISRTPHKTLQNPRLQIRGYEQFEFKILVDGACKKNKGAVGCIIFVRIKFQSHGTFTLGRPCQVIILNAGPSWRGHLIVIKSKSTQPLFGAIPSKSYLSSF